jgi:hypothetical protein
MRALQVVSGNEMYANKQQMLASPTSWKLIPTARPRSRKKKGNSELKERESSDENNNKL